MLKWILGCLGLILVVVVGVVWFGYSQLSKIAEKGPSVTVGIQATPQRVFASLADADSMGTWRAEAISSSRKGPLMIGDTLKTSDVSTRTDGRRSSSTTLVSTVRRDTVIAFEALNDSSGVIMFTRRDSVIASGDSTLVISTFTAPMLDSISAQGAAGQAGGRMVGAVGNMMVGAMRMQAELELKKLKRRIEGLPAGDTTRKP